MPVLVLAALAAVVAVIALAGGSGDKRDAATGTPPPPPPPETAPAPSPSPSPSPTTVTDQWPADTSGYSVMLASMTTPAGALEMQQRARDAGLEAAILRSDRHSDLRPGYWVVFSGTYPDSGGEAASTLDAAREAGFEDAYVRHVNAAATGAPPAEENSEPRSSATEGKDTDFHLATRPQYTVQIPDGWNVDARDVDQGSYVESRWHKVGEPKHVILVDHTSGYEGTPEDGAHGVRDGFTKLDGYEEIAFEPTTVGGNDAWRWEFVYKGSHTVDTFVSGCDTGYAILVRAPAGEFADVADDFKKVTESLTPTC